MLQQPTSGPEGSKLAYRQPGLWISGKLTLNFAQKLAKSRKNSHGVHKSVLHLKKNRKKCHMTYLTSNLSSDVKSTLIYSRTRSSSNHTQSQDTNRSTTLAGLSRNIDIGLQSQKVLKSFPGLAHHRRRNNMLV